LNVDDMSTNAVRDVRNMTGGGERGEEVLEKVQEKDGDETRGAPRSRFDVDRVSTESVKIVPT
jgi:hypothetical protein